MFWFGLVVALVGGLISIGLSREGIRTRVPQIQSYHLDWLALAMLIVGLGVSAHDHVTSQRDLSDVRDIAESDIHRAPHPPESNPLAAALAELGPSDPARRVFVKLYTASSSRAQRLVADDLIGIFREAGFRAYFAGINNTMSPTMLPPLLISCRSEAATACESIATALREAYRCEVIVSQAAHTQAGAAELTVHGEPIFDESGVVSFR